MQDEKLDDGSEWSADERAALDRLSMERGPSAFLRARTVGALRDRGLIAPTDVGGRVAPTRSRRLVRVPGGRRARLTAHAYLHMPACTRNASAATLTNTVRRTS